MRVRRHLTLRAVGAAAMALLVLPLLLAACGSSGGGAAPSPSTSLSAREQQLVDLVVLTAAAIEKDAAGTIAAINAAEAPYCDPADPERYAFVYSTEVELLADPDPTDRGRDLSAVADATGKRFRAEIVEGALANGSGWEDYVHRHPTESGLYHKRTYYRLVTGNDGVQYVVCSAIYLKPYESPSPSSAGAASEAPTKADVQAFVERAVTYAREHGREAALEAFTQKDGAFHQGQLYIYAYDFEGTVIGHGGDASLVGKNLIDMTDPNGVRVIQELRALAEGGSGWLYYTWPNPANGNRQEAKLGYVARVDDGWFLGSGTYGPAAVPPTTGGAVSDAD